MSAPHDGDVPEPRPIVGRDAELAALADAIGLDASAAVDGAGRAVLLAGDAGVGKSRLLTELTSRAYDAGWRVLVGHCLDLGDGAMPYLPFTDMLARLASDDPEWVADLVADRPALAPLLPDRRMLGAPDTAESRTSPTDLVEAVRTMIARSARGGPLLVVVEDVHWADSSTRELLTYLWTHPVGSPVALVVSYRSDDLSRRHPLRPLIAEWSRLPRLRRMTVGSLSEPAVRELVATLHDGPLPEHAIRDIVGRADGNAFFVEELVAATDRGGRAQLPDSLADLLLVRIESLDDDARGVVRTIAVAGRRVSHPVLEEVAGLAPDRLDAALRTALEANVLIPARPDGYAFRHALLAEAVYDDLLPGERVRRHAAYAAAIASGTVPGSAAELARHARAAHDLRTARDATIRAGDEALAVGGPQEAAAHYEAALALGSDDPEGLDLDALTVRAATALIGAGHTHRAARILQAALARPDLPPDGLARGRLQLALADLVGMSDLLDDPVGVGTESVRLLADGPVELRVRAISNLAQAYSGAGRRADAVAAAREALDLAESADLPDEANLVRTTLAQLEIRSGTSELARQELRATYEQARRAGDVAEEVRAGLLLGNALYEDGDLAGARTVLENTATAGAAAGRTWAPYSLDARMTLGVLDIVEGDWDGALTRLDVRDQHPPAVAEATLAAVAMEVRAGRGDLGALELARTLRRWWEKESAIAIFAGAAAIDLHSRAGQLEAALAEHDDVVAHVRKAWRTKGFPAQLHLAALAVGAVGDALPTCASTERAALVARAQTVVDGAADAMIRRDGTVREPGPEGAAWAHRLAAELARARWLADEGAIDGADLTALWCADVALFETFGHVHETARSRVRLVQVLTAAGRTAEAAPHADAARATARRLGAEPLLTTLRARTPSARSTDGEEALTPRESEVLALVAQGRTNGQIARQLFISTKTVSVHVSRILTKLDASGRGEAAAIAHRRGLLAETRSD